MIRFKQAGRTHLGTLLVLAGLGVLAACKGDAKPATSENPIKLEVVSVNDDPNSTLDVLVHIKTEPGTHIRWGSGREWTDVPASGEITLSTRPGSDPETQIALHRNNEKVQYVPFALPPKLKSDGGSLDCQDNSCGLMWADTMWFNGKPGTKLTINGQDTVIGADGARAYPRPDLRPNEIVRGFDLGKLELANMEQLIKPEPLKVTITTPEGVALQGEIHVPYNQVWDAFTAQFNVGDGKGVTFEGDTPAPAKPRGMLANGKIYGHPTQASEIDRVGRVKSIEPERQQPCPGGYGQGGSFKVTRYMADLTATVWDRRTGAKLTEKVLKAPSISCPRKISVGATQEAASLSSEVSKKQIDAFFASQLK